MNKRIHNLALTAGLLLVVGAIAPLSAGDSATKPTKPTLSLAALIKDAVEHNPGLKAARARWKAALDRFPQAKALPDPMIDYTYFAESVETRVGPQKHKISLAQPFPFPGALKSAGKATLQDIRIAQLAHELTLRNLIVDLKISYHELGYLDRAMTITQQNQVLMKHAVTTAQALYAKEKATLSDVLKAQAQEAQLQYDMILLRELAAVETAKINAILSRPTSQPLGKPAAPAFTAAKLDYETLEKQALADRQELLIAVHKVKKADELIRLARFKRLPQFKFHVGTVLTDDAQNPAMEDSGKDPVTVGLSMTLPWNLRKNTAAIDEAVQKHKAAEFDLNALQNTTRAQLRATWFKYINAKRLVALYEKSLIPQAKKAMQIAETWDVDGQKNFSGFLETQSTWLNFNLARLRAVTDNLQALARLERICGGTLAKEAGDEKK